MAHRIPSLPPAVLLLTAMGWVACAASPPDSGGEGEGSTPGTTGTTGTGFESGDGASSTTGDTGINVGSPGATASGGSSSSPSGSGGVTNLPGEDQLPEEVEDVEDYRVPVVTGRYLWSTNPESGRVALIDAKSLTVRVLAAGLAPTYLASIPGDEDAPTALVINVGSSDVTRFSVKSDEVTQDSVAIHPGANRWSTSEHWAVAWSAPEQESTLDPTEGLQEITILSLGKSLEAKRLAVGYRPSQVQIAADESHLNVVSEEGITIIELDDDPTSDSWVDLGFESEVVDVALSADGNYALVRQADADTVDIIDLLDPTDVATLQFSGPVTDVDLSPSGRAVVVIRQTRQIATFLLEEALDDPERVDVRAYADQVFGSSVVTEDGKVAVLYTNVVDSDTINVVNLEEGDGYLDARQLSTQSPIYSIVTAPGGGHAVVLAGNGAGSRTNAFSVISLTEARFPRVVGTGAPVSQVAVADDFALVTASSSSSATYEAHTIDLGDLTVDSFKIASEPLSVGVLPSIDLAYVAQKHAEGRVTFFDFGDDEIRTLTGFELSAEVVDE